MKITLITCTYNAAAVLQRTLDSVSRQTYADIEHIIIDGKSSDDTVALAEQYKTSSYLHHTGHQIRIVSERDTGLYDAMNKGLSLATGDYLCYLNAGDTLASPSTVSTVAAAASASPAAYGVIYGETDITDESGAVIGHRHHSVPERLTWRSFRHGMLVCHQAFYANTAVARSVRYDLRYRVSADVDWCIRVMKEAERRNLANCNVHQTVCHYLRGGMSVQSHRQSLAERFHTMRRHYGLAATLFMHAWFVVRSAIASLR